MKPPREHECAECGGTGWDGDDYLRSWVERREEHIRAVDRMKALGLVPPVWIEEEEPLRVVIEERRRSPIPDARPVENLLAERSSGERGEKPVTEPDEPYRPPFGGGLIPTGPVRHGIRWTLVTFQTFVALWNVSQLVLTADDGLEIAWRVSVTLLTLLSARVFAARLYRPKDQR